MPTQIRQAGVWRTISAAQVFANGAWRPLVAIKVYFSGSWRTVGNFTAPAAPPPSSSGSGSSGGSSGGGGGTITVSISPNPCDASSLANPITTSVTAAPSGGLAPYTYQWSVVTTDSSSVSFSRPTSATTAVSVACAAGAIKTATLQCTVTDSLGTTATAQVSGTFENVHSSSL